MTLDGWPRVKELFHAALECAPADRTAFLSAACGDDETLCAEVERAYRSFPSRTGRSSRRAVLRERFLIWRPNC